MAWNEYVTDPLSGNVYNAGHSYKNALQANIAFQTNKVNYDLAKEQNQWNLEQWQRQNEYNSPANQLRLLAQAGINPNSYSPQGMTAGSLTSADMSVAAIPQLDGQEPAERFNTMMQGLGGINDQVLNTLNTIFNAENLKAGIAESRLRQDQAKVMNPMLIRQQELQNNISAEKEIQERYASKNAYAESMMKDFDLQHYEEKFREDLKLTKSSSYLNNKKAAEALKMIEQLDVTTDIQKWSRDFMQKTGTNPNSDGVSQLIQLMLSDPGHGKAVINALVDNLGEVFGAIWNRLNPF